SCSRVSARLAATWSTRSSSRSEACRPQRPRPGRRAMEREVPLTGIGGQGVQLAAQVLARAAAVEGRQVMLFGVYSGMMRGGNSDSTVVVGDGPLHTPPLISRTWSAIVLHHKYWSSVHDRLSPGSLVVVNTPVFEDVLDRDAW